MKRWPVELSSAGVPGGASALHVYAPTLEAARRAAQAAFARLLPERDPAGALVRVGQPEELESSMAEARQLVSQVYEGLRLLPGMEMPAEKLRSAVLLLEPAAARQGLPAQVSADAARGGGGDNELREALEPVLRAATIPEPLKERLRGLVEWVGLATPEAERQRVEVEVFQALWAEGLIDPRLEPAPACELLRPSAYLVERLSAAGRLRVERFAGARDVGAFRAALRAWSKEAVSMCWAFAPSGEEVQLLRPLALLDDQPLQPALLARGVACAEEEALAFDRALFDALCRLQDWSAGPGRLAEALFEDRQRQLLVRTEKRLEDTRERMRVAALEGQPALPSEATRRDVMRFLIDQVHRLQDALAFLPDRSLERAFADLVAKDVTFRGAGAYLSKHHQISIDTEVVVGADSVGLGGRIKLEATGPRPRSRTHRIHSVVLPCYTQDGAVIRPAAVRVGDY